jgi:hypothetical protein
MGCGRHRGACPPPAPVGGAGRRGYARDPRSGYDLNSPGELVYGVQVHEDDDGGSGHGPRPLVTFELAGTPQAAADVVRLWAARGSAGRVRGPQGKARGRCPSGEAPL